jgi:putative SOS response-associated peptidase YedK
MCGRFTQNYTWEEVYAFLKVFGTPHNLRPHYNIAPTTNVDVIRLDREGRRELASMRWGLVPYFWKKSLKEVPATFNACRDDRRKADVPPLFQAPALHHSGVGLLRMDE